MKRQVAMDLGAFCPIKLTHYKKSGKPKNSFFLNAANLLNNCTDLVYKYFFIPDGYTGLLL